MGKIKNYYNCPLIIQRAWYSKNRHDNRHQSNDADKGSGNEDN